MRVIGLMSGTSIDGIDAALVEISNHDEQLQATLIAGETYAYPAALRRRILAVASGAPITIADLADLDEAIAVQFANAAIALQASELTLQPDRPVADLIGSHGQTVFHRPPAQTLGYSVQLGRGATIAHLTRTATVSNFRLGDLAVGGQGAPLVPPVDAALLRHSTLDRAVQNIGGIGNVTYLPSEKSSESIRGWDTGPGNMLIDLAVAQFSQGAFTYDENGAWAASGTPDLEVVDRWLRQDFFNQPPPKSTGREHFGRAYLDRCLVEIAALSVADQLATLVELTAASIEHSYRTFLPRLPDQVLIGGGGSRNRYLLERLQARFKSTPVMSTDAVGLDANFKEAIAFAVLAYWRYHRIPGNLPEVTGAHQSVLLGEIYQA